MGDLRQELSVIRRAPRHTLDTLRSAILKELKTRYHKSHRPARYGNIHRGFLPHELDHFLSCATHPTAHLAMETSANLGLRVGEVVLLNIYPPKKETERWAYLDLLGRRLFLITEKSGSADWLYLHDGIFPRLDLWIREHRREIEAHAGYVFYSTNPIVAREHISPNWLRNEFRHTAERARLNQSYGPSDEPEGKRSRRLFRLTYHSLRHSYARAVYDRGGMDVLVCQKAMRHRSIKSTMVYLHKTQEEVDAALVRAFHATHHRAGGQHT